MSYHCLLICPRKVSSFEETILQDFSSTLKSTYFLECNAFTLKTILGSDRLNCEEIEIFNGAMQWAENALKRKGLVVDPEKIELELGDCFNMIRFPVMTIKEFLNCLEKYPNILQAKEHLDILHFIVDKRSLKVAKLFSTNPRKRTGLRRMLSMESLGGQMSVGSSP